MSRPKTCEQNIGTVNDPCPCGQHAPYKVETWLSHWNACLDHAAVAHSDGHDVVNAVACLICGKIFGLEADVDVAVCDDCEPLILARG